MYHNASDMSTDGINGISYESSGCVFGLSITFIERTAHNDFHKLVGVLFDGCTSSDHEPDPASKLFPDLGEDNTVIEGGLIVACFPQLFHFGPEATANETALDACGFWELFLNPFNNSVEQPGDCYKNGGLDKSEIILKFHDVSVVETELMHMYVTKQPSNIIAACTTRSNTWGRGRKDT